MAALVLTSLFCGSASFSLARVRRESGAQTPSAKHACCRHAHVPAMPQKLFGLAPHGRPCGNQRPCCSYRSPENRSALPTVIRVPAPETARLSETATLGHGNPNLASVRPAHDFQGCSLRSMVLRI